MVGDQFFICEECRSQASERDLAEWSRSIMRQPAACMPIALWLIQEQNKNKEPFSRRK